MDVLDRIEKQLEKLELEALTTGKKLLARGDSQQWYAKALAYRVALAVVRNHRDPNWKD